MERMFSEDASSFIFNVGVEHLKQIRESGEENPSSDIYGVCDKEGEYIGSYILAFDKLDSKRFKIEIVDIMPSVEEQSFEGLIFRYKEIEAFSLSKSNESSPCEPNGSRLSLVKAGDEKSLNNSNKQINGRIKRLIGIYKGREYYIELNRITNKLV